MNEAETRAEHIDPALQATGWGVVEGSRIRREYPITLGRLEGFGRRGRPLTADYVLIYRNTKLGVVEAKAWGEQAFDHLLYHMVLTYSNWESVSICFSESFEALSGGFQDALWKLGGVPQRHRSDSLSAAVNNLSEDREFRGRYRELMACCRAERVDPSRWANA